MTNNVVAAVEAALNAAYVERHRAVVLAARRLARIEMAMRADPAGTQSLRERREAIIRDLVAAVAAADSSGDGMMIACRRDATEAPH